MTPTVAFRTDIQALRGLAILVVVLYHYDIGGLSAGFLGVDIFFVLSGFLITGLIASGINRGSFSLTDFYVRRIKRLLPAALLTLSAVTVASRWFLLPSEAENYWRTLLGSLTLTANVALWLQNGYFQQASELKPLLHMWSLAIEEQYYLLWPWMLVLLPRRLWLVTGTTLTIVSLVLCLAFVSSKPGAVFYLLPTRAWELGIGSLAALIPLGRLNSAVIKWLFWPALLSILALPTIVPPGHHPGIAAVVVCTATAIIVLRRHPLLNDGALVRMFARLGDISYSLYLVHWPLMAFANNAYLTEVPQHIRAGILLFAAGLALVQYRLVEVPFWRSRNVARSVVFPLATAAVAVVVTLGTVVKHQSMPKDYVAAASSRAGIPACSVGYEFREQNGPCWTSPEPTLMLWGDSFADHLVAGVRATSDRGFVDASRSACGPYLGMAQWRLGQYEDDWSRECMAFNRSVLEFLRQQESVEVVVLASSFSIYVTGNGGDASRQHLVIEDGGRLVHVPPSVQAVLRSLSLTIAEVRKLGKRVVVVAPPPSGRFDMGDCEERRRSGRVYVAPGETECSLPYAEYVERNSQVLALLEQVARNDNVEIIRFDDALCHSGTCASSIDGVSVYGHHGHFSLGGSVAAARRIGLGEAIERLATK